MSTFLRHFGVNVFLYRKESFLWINHAWQYNVFHQLPRFLAGYLPFGWVVDNCWVAAIWLICSHLAESQPFGWVPAIWLSPSYLAESQSFSWHLTSFCYAFEQIFGCLPVNWLPGPPAQPASYYWLARPWAQPAKCVCQNVKRPFFFF